MTIAATPATAPAPTAPTAGVARLLDPRAAAGPAPRPDRHALAAALDAAGLTGRGGAGFSTGRKLGTFLAHRPGHAVVLGNAMEGEPLSQKDAALLQASPGLVLDGLEIVAHALGASRVVLAVGQQIAVDRVRATAAARGSRVEVLTLPDRFVAGQESALVDAVDGGAGVPRDRLDDVRRSGVGRRPTLVLNAETLAHLALVARHGAGWWRSAGTPDEPGSTLVSVSGTAASGVRGVRVHEVRRGAVLADVLGLAGVDRSRTQAVLVGGFHGGWVPASALDTPLSRAGLAPWGAAPGAGVLHVMDVDDCPLAVASPIATYLAEQTAGQCGPCVNGLPSLARTLAQVAQPGAARATGAGLLARVGELADLVDGRGACAHPDGTARFVRSTMRVFADHAQAHLEGRCPR